MSRPVPSRLVRPFARPRARLLWPLLTPQNPSARLSAPLASRQVLRSPRVRRVTFTPRPAHIHRLGPDDFGLRVRLPPRPPRRCLHTLRVPRAGALPAASFGRRLAVVALAVRLTVPVIKARRGLAPPSHFPARFPSPVSSPGRSPWTARHAWHTAGGACYPARSGGARSASAVRGAKQHLSGRRGGLRPPTSHTTVRTVPYTAVQAER
jgi:hypothetical protein